MGRGGREDLTGPIWREFESGGFGQFRHALPPPTGEVRNDDVLAQVKLRPVKNPPAVWTTDTHAEGAAKGEPQHGISERMFRCKAWVGVQ